MDYLAEDTIILIAKNVAEHGTQTLFSFMRTSKDHLRICRRPTVLRSLLPEYANAIHNDEMPISKFSFLHMMIESGHGDFCIVWALNIMYDVELDVAEAKRVLKLAFAVRSETANYFLMMLNASSEGGEEIEQAVSTFTKFFKAQTLEALRDYIADCGIPYWAVARAPRYWEALPMPKGLVVRSLRQSKDTCKGDGRMLGYY